MPTAVDDEPQMTETYDATALEWRRPSDGKLHRIGAPAVEWFDGSKVWWQNGKLHRDDGPAYEGVDGTRQWFVEDNELTEPEFNKWRQQRLEEQECRRAETHQKLMEAAEKAFVLQRPLRVSSPLRLSRRIPAFGY